MNLEDKGRQMMKKYFDSSTVILLVLSVALNAGLAYKVRELTRAKVAPTLDIGTQISAMNAEDLAGKPTQVQFASSGEPTVLYVFSPTCRWCAKNLENVKKLYEQEHTYYRFVGVSLAPDKVPEYITESGFPLTSVKNPASDAVKTLHLAGTPETIVIDSEGVVREVWAGAYRPDLCREIETYFKLPAHSLTGI